LRPGSAEKGAGAIAARAIGYNGVMPSDLPPFPSGKFLFEFHGGPRDGASIFADGPPIAETALAHGLWFLTGGGAMGRRFQLTDANAIAGALIESERPAEVAGTGQRHVYEVVSRRESDSELIIDCNYRGAS
jgi:hypothetical protein